MKENGRIENVSSLDDDSSKRNGYYSRQEKEKSSLIDDSNGEYAVGGNSLDEMYEDNVYRNDLLGKIKRKKDTGNFLDRYYKSFLHAVDGLIYAIEEEHNIILMMLASILVLIASFFFNISKIELMLVIICIGTTFACELINSAIEACVDLETTKENPLAKIAKDCASSASLILSMMSLVIAGIIFISKIIALF